MMPEHTLLTKNGSDNSANGSTCMVIDEAGSNALEAGHGGNGSVLDDAGFNALQIGHSGANDSNAGSNALEAGHGGAKGFMMQATGMKDRDGRWIMRQPVAYVDTLS